MKKYINIILITSALLILFPFLGFSEIIENFYVIIMAFIIGTTTLLLRHKSAFLAEDDEETSLQDYVKELQDRFKQQEDTHPEKKSHISDVKISNE